jgi:hypothetical protein
MKSISDGNLGNSGQMFIVWRNYISFMEERLNWWRKDLWLWAGAKHMRSKIFIIIISWYYLFVSRHSAGPLRFLFSLNLACCTLCDIQSTGILSKHPNDCSLHCATLSSNRIQLQFFHSLLFGFLQFDHITEYSTCFINLS